jgi:serine/threonine protein kinase
MHYSLAMGQIDPLVPGARVGDYVLDSELAGRPGERSFVSTHVLLPRRARIVVPSERAIELARVLETIKHPAVPRIFECGMLPDRRPWLALAIVDGPTLATEIAERPLSVSDTIGLLADLAAVLVHVHAHGIVHGELRPDRIARTEVGWRIIDWSEAGPATDPATDLHALGVLAYGALARCLPTLPLLRRCPGVPTRLAQLIDRMISDPPAASQVLADATTLVEHTDPPVDDAELEPICLEDVILLELEPVIPPPLPTKLRWTPAGGLRPIATGAPTRTRDS